MCPARRARRSLQPGVRRRPVVVYGQGGLGLTRHHVRSRAVGGGGAERQKRRSRDRSGGAHGGIVYVRARRFWCRTGPRVNAAVGPRAYGIGRRFLASDPFRSRETKAGHAMRSLPCWEKRAGTKAGSLSYVPGSPGASVEPKMSCRLRHMARRAKSTAGTRLYGVAIILVQWSVVLYDRSSPGLRTWRRGVEDQSAVGGPLYNGEVESSRCSAIRIGGMYTKMAYRSIGDVCGVVIVCCCFV